MDDRIFQVDRKQPGSSGQEINQAPGSNTQHHHHLHINAQPVPSRDRLFIYQTTWFSDHSEAESQELYGKYAMLCNNFSLNTVKDTV
ncbi:MAG: hypothetical protein P1P82_14665 [Bacteroidales bacterium]|nr:hypothetical protein [Bacteroidales bacterium]